MWFDHLKEMKKESGLTTREIAERSGLPEPTLEKLFAGRTKDPKLSTVIQLVHFFGCTLDDLEDEHKSASSGLSKEAHDVAVQFDRLSGHGRKVVRAVLDVEGEEMPEPVPLREITVYDVPAAAGIGNYLDVSPARKALFPADCIPAKADFGVPVSGDSMEPLVPDGSVVFVQSSPVVDSGDIGVFVLNGESYCKRLTIDRINRAICLSSVNDAYDDIPVRPEDDFFTVGKVLGWH